MPGGLYLQRTKPTHFFTIVKKSQPTNPVDRKGRFSSALLMTNKRKKSEDAGAFNGGFQLPLVFGANTSFGTGEDFAAIGNKTPQDQDIFVVWLFSLFAKTAKLGNAIIRPTPSAFLLFFRHSNKSLKHQNIKTRDHRSG